MGEEFKVVAVVKFNDGEALVLDRPIKFVYEEVGRDYVGSDGPFRDFLGYGTMGGGKAFAGRTLHLTMADGSTRDIKDNWWSTYAKGYDSVVVGNVEALKKCYVFGSAHMKPEDYATLRATYTGGVFDYWDYEKILKHEYWVNLYIKESEKVRALKDKERKRVKRGDLIHDLLVGRSALLRAAEHVKDFWHIIDLHCTLEDDHGFLPVVCKEQQDHIGKWKAAGKEYGFGECEDERFEMLECPLCSAMYAGGEARKLIKARVGRINGILTRMGTHLRERE